MKLPKRRSSRHDPGLVSGEARHARTSEETVVFDAFLPKVLAFVSTLKEKLDYVAIVALEKKNFLQHINKCFGLFYFI